VLKNQSIVPESAGCVLDSLVLNCGDTVIVLDDDQLIHYIWNSKLEDYKTEIDLQFFEKGQETINFINAFAEKNRLFLLCDYELKQRGLNGIDVIVRSNMVHRSIIVSGICYDSIMLRRAIQLGVKILFKQNIKDIPIVLKNHT
jgi:response regulator of citrate/malate metabolism